jgi:hypothetical protein
MATEQQFVFSDRVRFLSSQSKANEISILPYAQINGAWTLSDDRILEIVRKCQEDGTFKRVFCEGGITDGKQFVEEMKRPQNVAVFVFRGTEPIGFAWLNGIAGKHAFAHFCFMVSAWGPDTEPAGRMLLDYWMSLQAYGEPVLDVIIGATPKNGFAASFAERIGFTRVGEIPRMIYNRYSGQKVPAVILYYMRS